MYFLKYIPHILLIIINSIRADMLYSVYIISSNNNTCTGFIVDENFVLTSASCLKEPVKIFSQKEQYGIKTIRRHPEYQVINLQEQIIKNNIALVELSAPIEEGSYIYVENETADVYATEAKNCFGNYMEKTKDGFDMNVVRFENLTLAKCDVIEYVLQYTLDVKLENICSKIFISNFDDKSNLPYYIEHSLPIFCHGNLYGFLSSASKNKDVLFWTKLHGYRDWIYKIINSTKDKPIIIEDTETYLRYYPLMLEALIIPKNFMKSRLLPLLLSLYTSSNMDKYIMTPLSPMADNSKRFGGDIISLWPTVRPKVKFIGGPRGGIDTYTTERPMNTIWNPAWSSTIKINNPLITKFPLLHWLWTFSWYEWQAQFYNKVPPPWPRAIMTTVTLELAVETVWIMAIGIMLAIVISIGMLLFIHKGTFD